MARGGCRGAVRADVGIGPYGGGTGVRFGGRQIAAPTMHHRKIFVGDGFSVPMGCGVGIVLSA